EPLFHRGVGDVGGRDTVLTMAEALKSAERADISNAQETAKSSMAFEIPKSLEHDVANRVWLSHGSNTAKLTVPNPFGRYFDKMFRRPITPMRSLDWSAD